MPGESKYCDFRDLDTWKGCKEIRIKIWKLCRKFPQEEKYRLSDQMIRSSRSASACIAEGYGRFHYKENMQFCRQARGSLYELIDHLDVAVECGYIERNDFKEMVNEISGVIKLLNGYIRYLRSRKENAS
jgi:four helix bundle protein